MAVVTYKYVVMVQTLTRFYCEGEFRVVPDRVDSVRELVSTGGVEDRICKGTGGVGTLICTT